jgi:phosphohistidine phosphatase
MHHARHNAMVSRFFLTSCNDQTFAQDRCMHLVVIRHGKAVAREKWHKDDDERPLTKDGAHQAEWAFKLMRHHVGVTEIWTSPWVRARQTAEIASDVWNLPLRECDWLAGGALQPREWIDQLPRSGDIAIVGHEPDLGEFLGVLCGTRPVPLKKAGIALLEGRTLEQMELQGLLSPKLMAALADMA